MGREAADKCRDAALSVSVEQSHRHQRRVSPAPGKVGTEGGYRLPVHEAEASAVRGFYLLPLPRSQPSGEGQRVICLRPLPDTRGGWWEMDRYVHRPSGVVRRARKHYYVLAALRGCTEPVRDSLRGNGLACSIACNILLAIYACQGLAIYLRRYTLWASLAPDGQWLFGFDCANCWNSAAWRRPSFKRRPALVTRRSTRYTTGRPIGWSLRRSTYCATCSAARSATYWSASQSPSAPGDTAT